ncbi:chloride channel protein [Nocardioides marmorisolisilvae]|uniref:chloride channel protein n=1 Tax=Nocardioides marmorisolisilvae TaxID=1542737 RepID=UPI001C8370B8|nr:chloride channel protein [Nocardioides marmorisolisilvae]
MQLRAGSGGLLLLAVTVGAGAAGFAILFRFLIKTFTLLLAGHPDYAAVPGASHPGLEGLGRWFLLGTPVIAGLLYGPLVHFFAREARGHGVPEVMYAVARRGGRIAPQVAGVKALASALCIGGGGSVGREGPIVQIGSALGSTCGQLLRLPEPRLRVLVASGAAGGIAATFNAPLAGVFFAMELILSDFAAQSFGMVVIAAVTASAIGRAALGDAPFLHLPTFTVAHPIEYLYFAVLGVLAGAVGVIFTRILYAIEDLCDALWRGPEWLRPAVGGLALGLLLVAVPEMYGVGYPVLGHAIFGRYALGFLVVLLIAKMVATSLTIGIGGSGGVFAPSLFVGAMLGSAFGVVANDLTPATAGAVGVYGLLGMGAVFAGAARAPITAVIIMFELTGEYGIILPLMTAIVLAAGVSHWLSADTIYTLKLRRRGVDLGVRETIASASRSLGELMAAVPEALPHDASLVEASHALAASRYGVLPVSDRSGGYAGVVTARAVSEAISDGRHDTSPVDLVIELPVAVRVTDPLDVGIQALDRSGCGAIPVLSGTGTDAVGWFDYQIALDALSGAGTTAAGSPASVG